MKILVVSPHTDDAELGCGGVIYKSINKYGADSVLVITLSHIFTHPNTNKSVDLLYEWENACSVLGITHQKYFNFPTRNFDSHRQQILDTLIKIRDEYKPDIVYTPTTLDVHQDHQVTTAEIIRAFKARTTILGYILPHNVVHPSVTNFFVPLSEDDVRVKLNVLSQYESQKGRIYMHPDVIKSALISIGNKIGVPYAEGFEVIRIIQDDEF